MALDFRCHTTSSHGLPATRRCAGQAHPCQRKGSDAALKLRPLPFRSLVRPRGDFSYRARRIAGERLRRPLHLLAELLRLVRNHLRLPRHELALALREFLRFLGLRQFLAELHRVRQSLVRQRCHLLAGGVSLGLEISSHPARHAQKAVNGLSALIETLLRELAAPSHSEICRLHRAFAALLREICCVSCHHLSPSRIFCLFAMLDWRLLFGGNLFHHILFQQLQKNAREQLARWNARKKSRRTGLTRRRSSSVRAISSGATTPLYWLNHRVVLQ